MGALIDKKIYVDLNKNMASTGDIEFCFTGQSLHSDRSLVQIVIGPASEVSYFFT